MIDWVTIIVVAGAAVVVAAAVIVFVGMVRLRCLFCILLLLLSVSSGHIQMQEITG